MVNELHFYNLNSNLNSRGVYELWTGVVTPGTEITYVKSLDNFPTARRLIFVFKYIATNNTIHVEIPYYTWSMNTNYGLCSSYSNDMYVQVKIIPSMDLSNTGCTLTWDSSDAYKYNLIGVLVEY